MRKLTAAAIALILIGATTGKALAMDQARSGNPRAGRDFAGHNCDACHMIARDQDIQPLITDYAPSFAEIANRPGTTPEALRAFLRRQHAYSNMPYPDLTPTDLADVVAYMMSLRHRHEDPEPHWLDH
jgi:mono/diheme cytochrome c family protein